jgi:D-ribose pyranase
MLKSGILNPAINSLLSRVRHTNRLVIADRGFPFWPQIETVDISLIDDVPQVLDVVQAILAEFEVGNIWMAEEFKAANTEATQATFAKLAPNAVWLPHARFKELVPSCIGLIRTGDTTQYANMILESA